MSLSPNETQTVRQVIASLLNVDVAKVVPEAHFFRTLGGTFDHLKPMRLEVEKALNVDIAAITNEINARTVMRPNGLMLAKSLKAIGEYLGLTFTQERMGFIDLYTIEFIEAITAKACEKRSGITQGANVAALTLNFPNRACSNEVRRITSRLLNVAVEHINGDSDLGQIDALVLASLISELNARWRVEVDRALEQITAAVKANKQGFLTAASRKKIATLMPGVDFATPGEIHSSFINRLGVIEAIVERDAAAVEADATEILAEPILRLSGISWNEADSQPLRDLQCSLTESDVRSLVALCCRHSIKPRARWESMAQRGIEVLVEYAANGRRNKKITALTKVLDDDWKLEAIPTLTALAAAFTKRLPEDVLVLAAQAIATSENLTQRDAVKRVETLRQELRGHSHRDNSPVKLD